MECYNASDHPTIPPFHHPYHHPFHPSSTINCHCQPSKATHKQEATCHQALGSGGVQHHPKRPVALTEALALVFEQLIADNAARQNEEEEDPPGGRPVRRGEPPEASSSSSDAAEAICRPRLRYRYRCLCHSGDIRRQHGGSQVGGGGPSGGRPVRRGEPPEASSSQLWPCT